MTELLIYSLLVGLMLGWSVGPTFILLVSTTVSSGREKAWFSAAGIIVSDILMAVGAFLGAHLLQSVLVYTRTLGVIAGFLLIIMGVVTFRKIKVNAMELIDSTRIGCYFKTFVTNIVNPFNWMFWMAILACFRMQFADERWWVGVILIFLVDIASNFLKIELILRFGKDYLMHRLRRVLNGLAIALIISGLYLVYKSFIDVS